MRKQLHQSGLEMLSKCGQQFSYRYLDGLKRRPSAYLICGTATDKAVGTDLNNKITTGELGNESEILDVARDAVENYPDKESIEMDEDETGKSVEDVLGETKDKAVRLVRAHHAEVAPKIRPAATNKKFSINVDKLLRAKAKELRARAENAPSELARVLKMQARHLNVAARNGLDFVGEFDIVEQWTNEHEIVDADTGEIEPRDVSIIRDTKTSKKSPNENTAHESNQLDSYATAHHVLYGKLPHEVKLDYLVDLKAGPKTMTLTSHRDEKDVTKFLNRLTAGVIQIESGNFVPASNNAWWCSDRFCSYHAICPYVKHTVTSIPALVTIRTGTGDAVE